MRVKMQHDFPLHKFSSQIDRGFTMYSVLCNVVIGCVAIIIILKILHLLHTLRVSNFWQRQGVRFIPEQYNVLHRILRHTNLVQMDDWIYSQMKPGEKYVGSTDEFGAYPILFLKDLGLIKAVCIRDFETFMNRRVVTNLDDLPTMNIFSKVLFFQQDQAWKDLRSKMSGTFTTGKIRRMFHIFNTSAKKLVRELDKELQCSPTVNLEPICGKFTVDVIASAAFGLETSVFENPQSSFRIMAQKLQYLTIFNIQIILKFALVVLFPKLAKKLKIIYEDAELTKNYFANLILSTIQHRKKHLKDEARREDFLQLMIDIQNMEEAQTNKKHTEMKLTDELIVSQSMQFFIAGLDTVQSALEFAPYALALNPDYQEKLFQELKWAVARHDGEINYEVVTETEYLDKVMNECLRFYSPGQRTERKSAHDYELPGTNVRIPAGTTIIIPMNQIHHDATYYPNPGTFDPERFSQAEKATRNPCAFMPFGIGPRTCIANRFAMIELKTALAHLVINFRFMICKKTTIPMKYKVSTTLKPVDGIWLHVEERQRVTK